MIDPAQLVISVLGVSLIVGLVWLIAGSKLTSVGDEGAVRERLRREAPGFGVGVLVIDVAGRAAIAQSQDGAEVALLFATGQRVTVWRTPAAAIRHAQLRPLPDGGALLELKTGDFTRHWLSLSLASIDGARGLLPGLLRPGVGA